MNIFFLPSFIPYFIDGFLVYIYVGVVAQGWLLGYAPLRYLFTIQTLGHTKKMGVVWREGGGEAVDLSGTGGELVSILSFVWK
jgi:hypothetical protein